VTGKSAVWTEVDIYLVASRAYDYAMQGRYQEAGVLFDGLLAVAPDNAYVRRSLAALHLKTGQALQALSVLDQAGVVNPTPAHRRLRLDALLALEWFAEAAQELAQLRGNLTFQERNRYAARVQVGGSGPS
jgi:predicted Zn-dependent protease